MVFDIKIVKTKARKTSKINHMLIQIFLLYILLYTKFVNIIH